MTHSLSVGQTQAPKRRAYRARAAGSITLTAGNLADKPSPLIASPAARHCYGVSNTFYFRGLSGAPRILRE
ncbi:hypothetical protein LHT11_04670 [Acetobacter indonesiensis]|uniref:hypothetical protein n=1 Tax=Acetobacter indonesiensis TaxID=104101 RepID=UPI001F1AC271|nr:hypothetical protein [Acetobacter indonesiensis]MCG0994495.1 hypothetical protein [Acetobacter indonesiensis]